MTKTDEYSHTSNYIYLLSKPSTYLSTLPETKKQQWSSPLSEFAMVVWVRSIPLQDIEQIAKALSRSSHLGPMEMALGAGGTPGMAID